MADRCYAMERGTIVDELTSAEIADEGRHRQSPGDLSGACLVGPSFSGNGVVLSSGPGPVAVVE